MASPPKKNNLQRYNELRSELKGFLGESKSKIKLPKGKNLNQVSSGIYSKLKKSKEFPKIEKSGYSKFVKYSIDQIWKDYGPGGKKGGKKKKGPADRKNLNEIFNPVAPGGIQWDWIYFYDLGVKLDEAIVEIGELTSKDLISVDNSILPDVDSFDGTIIEFQDVWPDIIAQIREALKEKEDVGNKDGVSVPYYIYEYSEDGEGNSIIKFTLQYEISTGEEGEEGTGEEKPEEPDEEEETTGGEPPKPPTPPEEPEEKKREKLKTKILALQSELDSVLKSKKDAREEMKEFKGDKEMKDLFNDAKKEYLELSKRQKEILKKLKDFSNNE